MRGRRVTGPDNETRGDEPMPPTGAPERPVLVLITGTGRSGTSTMSGTFHHLGLFVPGPYLGANDSNPKGFFESKWAVRFHNNLTEDAGIHIFDGRPGALARARAAVTPQRRAKVVEFLRKQAAVAPQVVVKDPRSVWAQELWREAAAEVGLDTRYVMMLRHPAEVVGSRTTYYSGHAGDEGDPAKRLRYEIFNVARWVNSSLISERETRGHARAFVRYTDLLEDWRPVLATMRDDLGLAYNTDLTPGEHHPVDDFIEPGLRRHAVTWDELDVPRDLQELAQEVWDALMVLADSHGVDEEASRRLDTLAERYDKVLAQAAAVSHDQIREAGETARAEALREVAQAAPAQAASAPAGRTVEEAGGRELVRALGGRVRRRLRRTDPRS